MAKLIVSMNTSLDGYVETQGGDDGSWLKIDAEVHGVFNEFAAGATAFVYGRRAYEQMVPYWPDAVNDVGKPEHERAYGCIWVDKPKLVTSTSLHETRWSTRVVGKDALAEIKRLKNVSNGYLLCYGGPTLVGALAQEGLVDEYALFVHPSTLGAGLPLFRHRAALELVDERRFRAGVLGLRYAVVKDEPQARGELFPTPTPQCDAS